MDLIQVTISLVLEVPLQATQREIIKAIYYELDSRMRNGVLDNVIAVTPIDSPDALRAYRQEQYGQASSEEKAQSPPRAPAPADRRGSPNPP